MLAAATTPSDAPLATAAAVAVAAAAALAVATTAHGAAAAAAAAAVQLAAAAAAAEPLTAVPRPSRTRAASGPDVLLTRGRFVSPSSPPPRPEQNTNEQLEFEDTAL